MHLATSITLALLTFSIVTAQPVMQKMPSLPDAGILPGNPLYILDIFFEKIQLVIRGDEALRLEFAEERLAEAMALSDKDLMNEALEGYYDLVAGLEVPAWHEGVLDNLGGVEKESTTKSAANPYVEITIHVI